MAKFETIDRLGTDQDGDMPDNEACESVIEALGRQHDRLGELLRQINDGRWWPDDRDGHADAAAVMAHARRVEESLREIAQIVEALKE